MVCTDEKHLGKVTAWDKSRTAIKMQIIKERAPASIESLQLKLGK